MAESFPAAERAAAALHLELHALKLENPPYDFVVAFQELARRGAQMVLILHSPLFTEDRSHIAALALRHGLPTMFASKAYADAGGLLSYGVRCARRAASRISSDLLVYLRKPLVDAEQCAEWALHHRLAIGAEVFLVHCRFVRLARFCFHRDLRSQ